MVCPKCGKELTENVCGCCGYDRSRDPLRYPTLYIGIPEWAERGDSAGADRSEQEDRKSTYDAAVVLEAIADNVRDLLTAAILYEKLGQPGYQDSMERAKHCRERAHHLERLAHEQFKQTIQQKKLAARENSRRGIALAAAVISLLVFCTVGLVLWKGIPWGTASGDTDPEISVSGQKSEVSDDQNAAVIDAAINTDPDSGSSKLRLNYSDVTIHSSTGESFTLKVSGAGDGDTIAYSSSDSSIASVDGNGRVKAVSNGTATITAAVESADGTMTTLTCVVRVVT